MFGGIEGGGVMANGKLLHGLLCPELGGRSGMLGAIALAQGAFGD